ncbi:MAG: winged helix-turn-helix domain-containing protein [Acidobacteriaceae bacterium]
MMGVVYQFGDFTLDAGRFELCRLGHPLSLERKPLELLLFLAERNGQLVTRAEIAQRLWEREVFVDTEHGINTAIRKIRYALRDDPDEPRFLQTVQGKGYRFIATLATQAAAIPDSPPVAANGGNPSPLLTAGPPLAASRVSPRIPLWIWIAAPLLLLAMAAAPFGLHAWRQRLAAAGIHSVAVLPLDNLSGDPAQDYFADGMTDELTTMLAKDSTLRIVSRTSVMQYKRAHRPLPEIARALNVDGIIEGSVARTGQHVHMTLQLIQANTDSHLWAESYDRDADDLELPADAAHAIAARLQSLAPSLSAVRYVNAAAHDAYLRGHYLWFTDRMDESGAYFRKATEIQPDYALAWAGLSDYYGEGEAGDVLDPRTSLGPQLEYARRALQLDPNLAEAHQSMGAAYFIALWDWPDADREMLRAISLDPRDGEMYYLRSCLLQALNRGDEAIAMAREDMELDPFARPYALASIYNEARQYDAALAEVNLRLEASPNNPDLVGTAWDAWRRKGNYKEAVDAAERWHILTGDPQSAANLRRAYERGGARGFILWEIGRRTMQAKTRYVSPVEMASYHAQLGEKEPTLTLLEEGYRQRVTDILWIQADPAYDFLHNDPRFRAIVQKTGVTPQW